MASNRKINASLGMSQRSASVRMAGNRTTNASLEVNQRSASARRAGENDTSNHNPVTWTDPSYVQYEFGNENYQDINKLFAALRVIQRMNIKEITPKLLKSDSESNGMKHEYQKVTTKTTVEIENEKLMNKIKNAEQELSEQRIEISRLQKRVESIDQESKSLNAQLHEKEMQLLKQNQGGTWKTEYEQLATKHNDLQLDSDTRKDEYHAMLMDKTKLESDNERLSCTLRKTEQELSEQTFEISILKKRVESVDAESKSRKAQLQEKERQLLKQNHGRNWKDEYEALETRYNDLQRKSAMTEDKFQAMMTDKTKLENEIEKQRTMLMKTEEDFSEQKNEISRLKKCVEKLDRESVSFKVQLQEKENQLQEQRNAAKKAYAEKDEALTRLSRHMGQQMSEGNPNITDLSDQNRPSKLGERYSELYDNEWTNAFEVLTEKFDKDFDDKGATEILRKILLESYKSAYDFSTSQMKEAEYKLSGSSKVVSPECKRLLKEARKHVDIKRADILLENVFEVTLSEVIDRRYLSEAMVQVFAKECFELCWLMSIQDPPVVLAEDPIRGSRFDTNIYRHFTSSGDTVDYVVWPALLLHKGGPLLTKGVAQPKSRPKSAVVPGENKKTDDGIFNTKSWSQYGHKVQDLTPAQVTFLLGKSRITNHQ